MAIFAIDVGNRRVKLGLVTGEDEIVHRLHFLSENLADNAESLEKLARDQKVEGIAISSVVPQMTDALRGILMGYRPLIVTGETPGPLEVRYDDKSKLGADRLAAAAGAYHIYGKILKRTIMVVDAGSAVTIDLVDREGSFLGGAILPGESISHRCLGKMISQLPEAEYEAVDSPYGTNTLDCMRAGVRASVVGAIEHLYKRFGDKLAESPFMLITGASASWIAPELSIPHMVDPDIVLVGLKAIWSHNNQE
mgnify:CR=1 FL=1